MIPIYKIGLSGLDLVFGFFLVYIIPLIYRLFWFIKDGDVYILGWKNVLFFFYTIRS